MGPKPETSNRCASRPRTRAATRPRLPGPMTDLQDRTRWEPAEAEAPIFDRWRSQASSTPSRRARPARLLDLDPAAQRHRRAAHGPRAQRVDPGLHGPLPPDARQADEVDRSAPTTRGSRRRRRSRSCCAARGPAARSSAARRSSSACGSGARSTAASIFEQFQRLGASCDYDDEHFTLDDNYVAPCSRSSSTSTARA